MKKVNLIDQSFAHTPTKQICDFYKSNLLDWDRECKQSGPTVVTDGLLPAHYEDADIALLIEPRELIPSLYKFVAVQSHGFDAILTHDEELLELPNAIQYTFGGCWIEPNDVKVWNKSKNISIISSGKTITTGHKLRHSVIGRLAKELGIDVYGRGYTPVEKKIDALRDYRFSIVIENSRQNHFFTEKLVDCFATGTIPIYWGMSNIDKYFAEEGMIRFHSIGQLYRILQMLGDGEDFYQDRLWAVDYNLGVCAQYVSPEDSIYRGLTSKGLI